MVFLASSVPLSRKSKEKPKMPYYVTVEIVAFTDRGFGVRAQQPINAGTVVYREAAQFSLPVQSTPAQIKNALLRYRNIRLLDHEYKPFFWSKSFICEDSKNADVNVLFPEGFYFNSSCRPNLRASLQKVGPQMEIILRAAHDISFDEELCIAYDMNILLLPRAARLDSIRQNRGYNCKCSVCIDQIGQHTSDLNRRTAGAIIMRRNPPNTLLDINSALEALELEGLTVWKETLHYDISQLFLRNREILFAINWLERARDMVTIALGPNHRRVEELEEEINVLRPN